MWGLHMRFKNTSAHNFKKCKYTYLIVGRSGSGKSSLVKALCDKYGFSEVLSYTDRPKRTPKENTHTFVSKTEMDKLMPSLCAFTKFGGHRYGVTPNMIDNADLYVIDPDGIEFLSRHYKGKKQFKIIGVDCDKNVASYRMLNRGDSFDDIQIRLNQDDILFHDIEKIADLYVVNDNFNSVLYTVYEYIIKNEG